MDGDVVSKMISGVFRIRDNVCGCEFCAIHNLQARINVLVDNQRYPLSVKEDTRDLAMGIVSLLDGLRDLVLRQGTVSPGVS